MRSQEVEALLGGPPGDYTTGQVFYDELIRRTGLKPGWRQEHWAADEGRILVVFNEDDRVEEAWFEENWPAAPPSPLERIRGWLRW
jgi:hypothetical protein